MIDARIPLTYDPQKRAYSPDQLATLATLNQQPEMNRQRMENERARLDLSREELEARKQEAANQGKLRDQTYEMNNLKLEEQKRAAENARKIQQVLADNNGDVERSIPGIRGIDPMAADAFTKHLDEQRKARLATDTSAATLQEKRAGMLANGTAAILNEADPAKRATMYGTTRAALIASGQFKAGDLPEAMPDEPTMRAWVGRAMTPEQQALLPSKTAGNDGLTPYQRAQVAARTTSNAETARHHQAMETKAAKGETDLGKLLKGIRAEEMNLEKEEATLATRREQIGNQTKTGKSIRNGKPYEITPEERAKLDTEYKGLDQRWNQVQTRKQELAAKRAGLQGGTLAGVGAAAPQPQQKAAGTGGKFARNAKGEILNWNGKAWVPWTGR